MRKVIFRSAIFVLLVIALIDIDILMIWLGSPPVAWKPSLIKILESLIWLSGATIATALIDLFFWIYFVESNTKLPAPQLLKKSIAAIVFGVSVTGIIGFVFEKDVTGIWATSGAISLILGFALRGIIQDVFSGIAMNIDGSFKAGDWIQLHSVNFLGQGYGKIVDIAWRTTEIQLENNNMMVVPNSMMGMIVVTNFAHAEHISRLEVSVVIDFDVPTDRAKRILLAGAEAAAAEKSIFADPKPQVILGELTERGVTYKVRFWGRVSDSSPSTMQDAVMSHLLRQLRISGMAPAYPKEDMFFERRPKRLLDHDQSRDRAEVISRIELFSRTFEAEEFHALARSIDAITFPAGCYLVKQGDPGESMFVVAEGIADVYVSNDAKVEPVLVNRLFAGQIFGEMSLLTHEPRSASVVAHTSVVAYEIGKAQFEQLLASRPAIVEQLSAIVASKRILTDAALSQVAAVDLDLEARRLTEKLLERARQVFREFLGTWKSRTVTTMERGG